MISNENKNEDEIEMIDIYKERNEDNETEFKDIKEYELKKCHSIHRKTSIIDIFLNSLKDMNVSFLDNEFKSKEPFFRINFNGKRLINPKSTQYLRWILLIFILALYSGISTPIEVAFIAPKLDTIFWINRVIDLFFWIDIAFNFRIPYRDPQTQLVVTNLTKIKKQYLRYWFIVDFLAVIPADIPGIFFEQNNGSINDDDNNNEWFTVRFLRLLRMIKLLRLLRAAKSLQQYEKQMLLYYQELNIFQGILKLLYIIHLMACGLVGFSTFSTHSIDWETEYGLTIYDPINDEYIQSNNLKRYLTAAYWATMTTTTIGYGDVSMVTNNEKIYAIFCMIIGASLYAFMTARFAQIILYADKTKINQMETINQLNLLLNNMKIPNILQYRVQDYFHHLHQQDNNPDTSNLLRQLSPALRGHLAMYLNGKWVQQVDFFRDAPIHFITNLSLVLNRVLFSPKEIIIHPKDMSDRMYIIKKGIVLYKDIIMTRNQFFGEEMILARMKERNYWAVALNYVDTSVLSRNDLFRILSNNNEMKKRVKKSAVKIAFRAKIKEWIILNKEIRENEKILKNTKSIKHKEISEAELKILGTKKKTASSLREYINSSIRKDMMKEKKYNIMNDKRLSKSKKDLKLLLKKKKNSKIFSKEDMKNIKYNDDNNEMNINDKYNNNDNNNNNNNKKKKVKILLPDDYNSNNNSNDNINEENDIIKPLKTKSTPYPNQLRGYMKAWKSERKLSTFSLIESEDNNNNNNNDNDNDNNNDNEEVKIINDENKIMDDIDIIIPRRKLLKKRQSWSDLREAHSAINSPRKEESINIDEKIKKWKRERKLKKEKKKNKDNKNNNLNIDNQNNNIDNEINKNKNINNNIENNNQQDDDNYSSDTSSLDDDDIRELERIEMLNLINLLNQNINDLRYELENNLVEMNTKINGISKVDNNFSMQQNEFPFS